MHVCRLPCHCHRDFPPGTRRWQNRLQSQSQAPRPQTNTASPIPRADSPFSKGARSRSRSPAFGPPHSIISLHLFFFAGPILPDQIGLRARPRLAVDIVARRSFACISLNLRHHHYQHHLDTCAPVTRTSSLVPCPSRPFCASATAQGAWANNNGTVLPQSQGASKTIHRQLSHQTLD
jgi:hypothetical protein